MKLPYTPLQWAARHGEEDGELADGLGGMPVVCCSLHSQLAPVCAGLDGLRVAYVQLAGGALARAALGHGQAAAQARAARRHALGRPVLRRGVECVGIASALAWAAGAGYQAVVCAIGPGIVGTGTSLGHGGLGAADAANAAVGARRPPGARGPGLQRRRARPAPGRLPSHARGALALPGGRDRRLARRRRGTGLGRAADEVDVAGWRQACGDLPLSHMGRGPEEEPWFFAAAFAAGGSRADLAG